jgi:hypothetical protein
MKIIIVNGAPRSGKDTFVNFCLDQLGSFGYAFSTVDFIKDIAKECGWNGEKTPKDRKFLSDLKQLLTDWNDVPYQMMRKEIAKIYLIAEQYGLDHDKFHIFIHCREPEEIHRFVEDYGALAIVVRRDEAEEETFSNSSDESFLDYTYNAHIWNNGDLNLLKLSSETFLENLSKF